MELFLSVYGIFLLVRVSMESKSTVVGIIISHIKTASKVTDDCFEHDKDCIEFKELEQ